MPRRPRVPVEGLTYHVYNRVARGGAPFKLDDEAERFWILLHEVKHRKVPGTHSVEILQHEPHVALAGGEDGTDLLKLLLTDVPRLLAAGGHALLEMGPQQRTRLGETIAATGLLEVQRGLDHAGIERVLVLQNG